jgi:hypothetical protein
VSARTGLSRRTQCWCESSLRKLLTAEVYWQEVDFEFGAGVAERTDCFREWIAVRPAEIARFPHAALTEPLPANTLSPLGRSIHVRGKGCAHDQVRDFGFLRPFFCLGAGAGS